jgi:hypothetical protein
MQLKPEPSALRHRLIAASCALLAASTARSQDATVARLAAQLKEWQLDSALAYYHEDGRVQAVEPVVSLSRDYGDGRTIDANLTFDSLSGASPNGALPSRLPQTFASPSGKSLALSKHLYTVAPGRLPADPDYSDQRVSIASEWTLPLTRLTRATVGGKFSYEDDFLSLSFDASIAHDFNEKNTTVSIGVNDENDFLDPIGGTPVPLSDYAAFDKTAHQRKNGVGVLLSVTQVMTRTWLSSFNVSADRFSGYLNDPYKIVSVLDAAANPQGYVYENRPDSRTRRSAYFENRLGGERSSAALTLRYMTDTWGIHSDTAQIRVRWWNVGRDQYLEPTVRWYRQSAADFFSPWISPAESQLRMDVASDSRLDAFRAMTYGVKYGLNLSDRLGRQSSEFSVRIEYYQQSLQDRTPVPAALQGLDLFPNLKAILLQFGFSY